MEESGYTPCLLLSSMYCVQIVLCCFLFLLSADLFFFFHLIVFVIEGIYSLVYCELDLYGILL